MSRAPLTLKLHALLVLGAAALAPDHDAGGWWIGIALAGLGVLWVLSGSLFGWWIQAVAVGSALAGVFEVWRSYGDDIQPLRVFVPPMILTVLTAMLFAAAVLLLLPATRSYCSDRSNGPRSTAGIALGGLFVGAFPAMGLSLDPRLPSDGMRHAAPNLELAGHDPTAPSAFLVGGVHDDLCLVILEPRSGSSSCERYSTHDHDHAHHFGERTGDVAAWLLPKHITRVSVVYDDGSTREARLLDGSDRANVFYTTESPHDARGIRAYDASGEKVIGCRFC